MSTRPAARTWWSSACDTHWVSIAIPDLVSCHLQKQLRTFIVSIEKRVERFCAALRDLLHAEGCKQRERERLQATVRKVIQEALSPPLLLPLLPKCSFTVPWSATGPWLEHRALGGERHVRRVALLAAVSEHVARGPTNATRMTSALVIRGGPFAWG